MRVAHALKTLPTVSAVFRDGELSYSKVRALVRVANRAYASRFLTIRRHPERGTVSMTVELPLEAGDLIDKALDKARDDNPALEFAGESWSAQQADALVTMANAYLGGNAGADSGASENYLVNLHVEQSALVNGQGRAGLSPQTLRGRSPRPTLVGRR